MIIAVAAGCVAAGPPLDASPAPARRAAQLDTGRPGAWPFATFEIGLLAGHAEGIVIDPARTHTAFTQSAVRLAFHFGPTGSGVLRGNFAVVTEAVGMWVDQSPRAAGGGLNLLVRYTWVAGRWRPMLDGGAGILYSNEQIPPGETTRNFTPQAGVGVQYLLTRRLAVDAEYRFHHLSNKGRTKTNPGINSQLFLLGVSWYH